MGKTWQLNVEVEGGEPGNLLDGAGVLLSGE